MSMPILAQLLGGHSVGQLAITVVVVVAVCGLVAVAMRQAGVTLPAWVSQVLSILVVAVVIIVAIRIVLNL